MDIHFTFVWVKARHDLQTFNKYCNQKKNQCLCLHKMEKAQITLVKLWTQFQKIKFKKWFIKKIRYFKKSGEML